VLHLRQLALWRAVEAFSVLLAVVFMSQPSQAFVQSRCENAECNITRATAQIHFVLSTSELPRGMTATEVAASARRAARLWTAPCSSLTIDIATEPTYRRTAEDGVSSIAFRRRAWCRDGNRDAARCYEPEALAMTTLYRANKQGTQQIVEADIELNAFYFDWASGGAGEKKPLDLVLAHELGHSLGLAHNCDDGAEILPLHSSSGAPLERCEKASASVREALMFPSYELKGRPANAPAKLPPDEARALCSLYPLPIANQAPGFGCVSNAGQGCRMGRGATSPGVIGALAWMVLLGLARRRLGCQL